MSETHAVRHLDAAEQWLDERARDADEMGKAEINGLLGIGWAIIEVAQELRRKNVAG